MNSTRDTSTMDTLPLNGNFNNSYSLRNGDYGNSVQAMECGLGLDDAAFEKMIISKLVHNNLRACGKGQNVEGGPPKLALGGGGGGGDDSGGGGILDDCSSLVHGDNIGLELLHKELEAPLLPQRTHSLLCQPPKTAKTEGADGFTAQLPAESEDGRRSPNRDSLYASLPNLRDSPYPEGGPETPEDVSPEKGGENDDAYYKSMPNLGDGLQPQVYYHISSGNSNGYIIPISDESCVPEGDVKEGQMQLVTSL